MQHVVRERNQGLGHHQQGSRPALAVPRGFRAMVHAAAVDHVSEPPRLPYGAGLVTFLLKTTSRQQI